MLVLYTSATGSGKTISPIALSVKHKIIYICAARHVELALAKSAISIGKCVAFAFGCESADNIRLHYYSAIDYTKHKKSGSIKKVDNSNGVKVEIMICDIASYLIAMYYMLSFNDESNIILYWDEPTITLDVIDHPLHSIIHDNWSKNKISKVVLSSATLPKLNDIRETIEDFRTKFTDSTIHTISSFDYKKTISILDCDNKCILPHLFFSEYNDIVKCIEHCKENKSLLRYLDLREIIRFTTYIIDSIPNKYQIENYFTEISEITISNVKYYYLLLLSLIPSEKWYSIHLYMKKTLLCQFQTNIIKNKTELSKSGMLLTTEHSNTLTDGPTIYLTDDVPKIGKFLFEQSKIPQTILNKLLANIEFNENIVSEINDLTRTLNDEIGNDDVKEMKLEKENGNTWKRNDIMDTIEKLRYALRTISISTSFIPNTVQHQEKWLNTMVNNAFIPMITENCILEIMELKINAQNKLLLLLGVGLFYKDHTNDKYTEIIKSLATSQ